MKPPTVVVVLLSLALAGCMTTSKRQTKLMESADLTISAAALRVQVRSLADRFSGLMEVAGEAALKGETDPELRRNRLLWLINGIPAMQQALFQPDPLAALLDAWFLVAQLRVYFDESENIPPEVRALADSVLDEMEADIRNILENAGPDTNYERARSLVYEKAAENPVDRSFAARRGSAVYMAEFTARAGGSALQSIGSVTESLDDLVARIDLDAEWIPKLARWQAMMLADDYGLETLQPTLERVGAITETIDSLLPALESAPDLVARERQAVLETVHAYLEETLAFVENQRSILMQEDVRTEREAVFTALAEERAIVLAALADERRVVLEALHQERVDSFDDLESLVDGAVSRQLDRLFLKAVVLIVVFLAGLAIIAFLFARSLRNRGS